MVGGPVRNDDPNSYFWIRNSGFQILVSHLPLGIRKDSIDISEKPIRIMVAGVCGSLWAFVEA